MLVQGFDPVVGKGARVLILGTLPGGESLRLGQYYADKSRNMFWSIIRDLFEIDGRYDERVSGLIRQGVAIWDVLKSAKRSGSLDTHIVRGTEEPNDFGAFFAVHPTVATVCFNGGEAERYFRKLVAPRLGPAKLPRLFPALPSTSCTNTHHT